jgi:type IV pilus assembly protein PilO
MPKPNSFSLPFDKISQLTRIQRILICVGTFLVIGGLFFYLVYMPKSGQIRELTDRLDNLETQLVKARADASKLAGLKKEYEEAQGKFRLVLQLLPDKKEIPSLLENVSASGRLSGLDFLLFQPDREIARDFYAEIPVKINVSGGYHNLALFFDKVARLSRIVNISDINIVHTKSTKGEQTVLKASCTATTYRFIEEESRKKDKKKKKKG